MTDVALLWLEPTPQGTAARTHLDGTRSRLKHLGLNHSDFTIDHPSATAMGRIRQTIGLVRRVFRATHRGDVVVARAHVMLGPCAWLLRRRGRRLILLVQGNGEAAFEAHRWLAWVPGARRFVALGLSQADYVLTLNEQLEQYVLEQSAGRLDPSRVRVLPSGVADAFHHARRAESADNARSEYVVFFGNLAPWQGLSTLLEAVASPQWPEDLGLRIVGDGADRALLETLRPGVEWLGKLPPAELAHVVGRAFCSICPKLNTPSMAEVTTPFKVLESVAAGVPVVVSDIPAQVRLVDRYGYGVLFTAGDAEALARSVAALRSDGAEYVSKRSASLEVAPTLDWRYHADRLGDAIAASNPAAAPVGSGG